MLAYGKNMPKINQFSVLCPELIKNCPEEVKNYSEKNLPKSKKILPRKENLPNTCSPANMKKKFLIDNLYKTNFRPVRNECFSCRVNIENQFLIIYLWFQIFSHGPP